MRAAVGWVLDEARGASAGAAKRLGYVVVLRDDLRTEPPEIANVQWMPLRLVEALVVEKKHAFVYVVVSEVYRQREAFQIAVGLRQIWIGDTGEPMHAPLGDESKLLEFVRTPQGLQLVLSSDPKGK